MAQRRFVVLVVEDDPIIRMGALNIAIDAGFEALEAENADQAIRLLEARADIDVVFTDVVMPGAMDGIRLSHHIRDRWPPVKLIVASGKATIDARDLPAGARFFPKPYSEGTIVQAMTDLLDERAADGSAT